MNMNNLKDRVHYQLQVGIAARGLKDGLPEQEIVERLMKHRMAESQARALIKQVKERMDNMINSAKEL